MGLLILRLLCVCAFYFYLPQTHAHSRTQVYIEHLVDVITTLNRASARFCIFLFLFRLNLLFFMFLNILYITIYVLNPRNKCHMHG